MSHTNYTFSLTKESFPRQQMVLRSITSAVYDGDWHSTPHTHNYTELFYIVGGDGQFQINDTLFPVHAHQLVVVNPGTVHTEASYKSRPLEYIVLGVEGLEMTVPGSGDPRLCIFSFPENNGLLSCMQNVLTEMQARRPGYQSACLAYLDLILVHLIRHASVSLTQTQIQSRFPTNRQCAAVRQYIDQHYKESLTLDMLAEKVSINKFYMAHTFKREYGVSPINYLISCRIREGKQLLAETDLSLSQIATILGFSSSSYFSQSFRNAESISPTEYRKANQVKF